MEEPSCSTNTDIPFSPTRNHTALRRHDRLDPSALQVLVH